MTSSNSCLFMLATVLIMSVTFNCNLGFQVAFAQQAGQRFCCYGNDYAALLCYCIDAQNITSPPQCPSFGTTIWDDFWVATDDLCCRYQNLVLTYPFYDFNDRRAVWRWLFSGSIGPAPAGEDLVNVTTLVALTNNYTECFIKTKCPTIPDCADSCTEGGGTCTECSDTCGCPFPSSTFPADNVRRNQEEASFPLGPSFPALDLKLPPRNESRSTLNRPLDSCAEEGESCQYDPLQPCDNPPCCCAGLACFNGDLGCDDKTPGCTCIACG